MGVMTGRLTVVGTIGAVIVSGAVLAVPAQVAAAGPTATRVCTSTGAGEIPLRVKVVLLQSERGGNDLRGVRVRATDRDGAKPFRDSRVRVGSVRISVEGSTQESKGGQISAASGVQRQGSPAVYRLNPNSNGANVSRVTAEVVFALPGDKRKVAFCAPEFR